MVILIYDKKWKHPSNTKSMTKMGTWAHTHKGGKENKQMMKNGSIQVVHKKKWHTWAHDSTQIKEKKP